MLVDDRHAVGLEAGHRPRDKILNRTHLIRPGFASPDPDADGGGRLFGLFLEQLALGQNEVNPRRRDPVERVDRPAKLALKGALAVELLDEIRLPHGAGVVEDFVSDGSGGRQPLAGQHQAGGRHLVARHQDRRTITLHFIFDAGLIQGLRDRPGFLEVEVGIEQGFRLAEAGGYEKQSGGDTRAYAQDCGQAAESEPLKRGQNLVQRWRPLPNRKRPTCDSRRSLGRIYPVLSKRRV